MLEVGQGRKESMEKAGWNQGDLNVMGPRVTIKGTHFS